MFNKKDMTRNEGQLVRGQGKCGYDSWWHSLTGRHAETGEEKAFFIEFFTCNPSLGGDEPIYGQHPDRKTDGKKPSYLMVKAGSWGEDAAQLHKFWGWNNIEVSFGVPFSVNTGTCYCTETEIITEPIDSNYLGLSPKQIKAANGDFI